MPDIVLFDRFNSLDVAHRRTFLMGLPKALDPSELVQRYQNDARQLQAFLSSVEAGPVACLSLSAAGTHYLGMLATNLLQPPDKLCVFDPASIQKRSAPDLLRSWVKHQLGVERTRPDAERNQRPMPPDQRARHMSMFWKTWRYPGLPGPTAGPGRSSTIWLPAHWRRTPAPC